MDYVYAYARKPAKERKQAWKEERKLTVYEGLGGYRKAPPRILLQGKWLEEAEFCAGDKITVHCERGKLVITRDELAAGAENAE